MVPEWLPTTMVVNKMFLELNESAVRQENKCK